MASRDRGTDQEIEAFRKKSEKILALAKTWTYFSKKYLEDVLQAIEYISVYYSQGNGNLCIDSSDNWEHFSDQYQELDSEALINSINQLTEPELGITVSGGLGFPQILDFDCYGLKTQEYLDSLNLEPEARSL